MSTLFVRGGALGRVVRPAGAVNASAAMPDRNQKVRAAAEAGAMPSA
jgi:hypothetical protein